MTNLYDDLTARMVPAPVKVREALGDIADTGRTMAVVPIAFPGKEYGIWCADTEVENDIDGCFPCDNDDSYRAAREAACFAAARRLGERPGTVGYVIVRNVDGVPAWSVFEEILSPLKVLEFATKEGAR